MAAGGAGAVRVIGAPTAAGAYGPGQDRTPGRLREAGLLTALRAVSLEVSDLGDVTGAEFADDPRHPDAQNPDAVARVASAVAQEVSEAIGTGAVLVLGGDCTVEVGVVAGALRRLDGRVGLAYVDLDADMNVPASGSGRLDWMGVGHMLDLPGAVPQIAALGPRRPLLDPADVRLFGTANLTDFERSTIDRLEVHVEPVATIEEDLDVVLARTSRWAQELDALLVHVDVDVLDFDDFPLAENTRRQVGGLSWRRLHDLLIGLCGLPQTRSLTVSEINLDHNPEPEAAALRVVELLAACLRTRD